MFPSLDVKLTTKKRCKGSELGRQSVLAHFSVAITFSAPVGSSHYKFTSRIFIYSDCELQFPD